MFGIGDLINTQAYCKDKEHQYQIYSNKTDPIKMKPRSFTVFFFLITWSPFKFLSFDPQIYK